MKLYAKMLMVLCAVLASVSYGNLVTNGDFSNGSAGWSYSGYWYSFTNAAQAYFGNPSTGAYLVQQLPATFQAGTTYDVSWSVQTHYYNYQNYLFGYHHVGLYAGGGIGSGTPVAVWNESTYVNGQWVNFSKSFTLTNSQYNGQDIYLVFYGYPFDYVYKLMFADNFVVTATIPEPATMAILGLGSLMLFGRKR